MPSKITRYRLHAFKIQSGKCYYCEMPMWEQNVTAYASIHGITLKQAKQFKSTAEHLIASQNNGLTISSNIVAACLFCNSKRHKRKTPPEPLEYKELVRKRLSACRWNSIANYS